MLSITLNGKTYACDQHTSIAGLIQQLQLDVEQVAIERNRILVPCSQHGDTYIEEGDHIEVVTFIGGG